MKRGFYLLFCLILIGACSSSNQKAEQGPSAIAVYTSSAKTMAVGAIPSAVLHDAQRNKDLEFSIEYPTEGGPYPVVIFSPEYGGSNLSYVGMSSYWASHGYVVMKPKHADAGATRELRRERAAEARKEAEQQRGRRRPRQQTQQAPPPFRPDPAELWDKQTPADWQNRVADIRFLIDSLPAIVTQFPELKPRLDPTKVGVGGHSYGAFTALLIGGMRTFNTAGAPTSYADPRVKAIVAMSPPGVSASRGLTAQSFADLKLPVLFLTGSRDFGATESEDAAWRKQAFQDSPPGDKWFLSLQGAGHAAFTGGVVDPTTLEVPRSPDYYPTPRTGPVGGYPQMEPQREPSRGSGITFGQANFFNAVRAMSLAFWDAYLKNETAAKDYLGTIKTRGDVEAEAK